MAARTEEESFVLSLGIQAAENQDIEKTIRQLQRIYEFCDKAGKSADFAARAVRSVLRDAKLINSDGGISDTGNLAVSEAQKNLAAKRRREEQENERREEYRRRREQDREQAERSRRNSSLARLANPFAFITPKSGVDIQRLANSLGAVVPQMNAFSTVFQSAKGVWDFASAIASLNTKILQLGYTSGLGAQSVKDLGAAVAAFGGSAEQIAQGNEKFVLQVERLKRGGGLGYLGEVAYKYGFMVDLSEDWATNNKAAIDYARQMIDSGDKTGAMAFLKEWDSANFTSNMMKASMPAERIAASDAFYKSYEDLGDVDEVTKRTQEFNEETAKAARAWEAITNQLASLMLPVMTQLASIMTSIADKIAKSPGAIKTILTVLGGVLTTMTALVAKSALLVGIKTAMIAKERLHAAAATATAAASGNWAGAIAAAAILGIGLFGMGAALAGGGNSNLKPVESVDKNAKSIDEFFQGGVSGRQQYLLDNDATLAKSAEKGANALSRLAGAADKVSETMKSVADEALGIDTAAKQLQTNASATNISNITNSNAASNINVHVEQMFNEADTSEIREGTFNVGETISEQIAQASRRFNE